MRSEAVRRPHVARPRRDTIAVTIPKKAIWIAVGAVAGFGLLSCAIGIWIGRGTAERPAPVSTRVVLAEVEPPPPPPPPPPPANDTLIEEPPPPAPKKPAVKLDIRERLPRGKHGLQVGAFPNRQEARKFLENHSIEFSGLTMYVLPAKTGSRGAWYRVRVGTFDTAAEAEKARKALPDDLAKSSMVVRYN